MYLYRILLENYRGVRRCEVVFNPTGVTVVHGPNEIGKSSLIEALDLMLRFPSTTSRQEVQEVRPKGRAQDPVTEIEIGAGEYRLRYRKLWRKNSGKTELQILEPATKRNQFVNNEAQAKFEELLAECEVDLELWKLLRVSQDKPLGRESKDEPLGQPTKLAVRPAVAAALDAGSKLDSPDAAGDGMSTAFSGPQEKLFIAVEKAYLRHYTPKTGEPTGEYNEAIKELSEATTKAGEAKESLALAQDTLAEHERVKSQLAATAEELAELSADIKAREQLIAEAGRLAEQVHTLNSRLELAELVADADHELTQRKLELTDEQARYATAKAEFESAEETHERMSEAAGKIDALSGRLADAVTLSAKDADYLREKDRLTRLDSAVTAAERAQKRIEDAHTKLACNGIDRNALTVISDAFSAWDKATSALEANAATVRVERLGDGPVEVNGVEAVGGPDTIRLVDTVTVEAAGTVRVVVAPGSGEQGRREKERKTRAAYDQACRDAGVTDLSHAQAMALEHDAAVAQREVALAELTASLSGVKAEGKDLVAVRQRATTLRAAIAAYLERRPSSAEALPTSFAEASERHVQAQATSAQHAVRLQAAAKDASTAERQLAESRVRLRASERALQQSDDLVKRAQVNLERMPALESPAILEPARMHHVQATARLAELNPEQLTAVQENKHAVERQLREDAEGLTVRAAGLSALIADYGEHGPEEAAERARDRAAQAQHRFEVLQERAEAAKLLRATLIKHRSAQHARYAGPFRDLVEGHAAVVFGNKVNLQVEEDLTISSKTVDGSTVPFNSLSTGAREQLALLGRIACTQLIAPGSGGVPLILDDTLGHSDRQRIDQIAAILDRIADTGAQVIILTHAPERFRIRSALRVDLAGS